MGLTYGLLSIEDAQAEANVAAGDPLLTKLGAACQAIVNARCGALWASVCPRPKANGGAPQPVVAVFEHDPNERVFNARDLPAFFLFREKIAPQEWAAEDLLLRKSTIKLIWVFPREPQEKTRIQSPMVNAVSSAIGAALWNGQDAAWVDPTDTNPKATTAGSLIVERMGLWTIQVGEGRMRPVKIDMLDGSKRLEFAAFELSIDVEEQLVDDLAVVPGGRYASPPKMTTTVQTSDDPAVVQISLRG